jgi:hypothetical protein
MGDLIRADFANRRRAIERPASSFPTTEELRETDGYDRVELLERSVVIAARMAIALLRDDDLEVQDLSRSWDEHAKAVSPEMTPEEVALINRQANQIIDQL